MRKLIITLSLILMSAFSFNAIAQEQSFDTIAPHAVIIDFETGAVLYEKDARRPIAPASMTKIMTAEIVFDQIRNGTITPDTKLTVSKGAWLQGGSSSGGSTMFLDPGSSVSVEDLLRGVIIQSGNDACIVLAEGLSGSEAAFADLMTQKAQEMGLTSASFKNSTGLPHPEHRISLIDLGLLGRHTIANYPEFYPLYSEESYEWNGIKQDNRNPLLGRFDGADGLKTGYTQESGYGLVGSAQQGDVRRIIVFSGLSSKAERREVGLSLMNAAFNLFGTFTIYETDDVVTQADIFMGKQDKVDLIIKQDAVLGMAKATREQLEITVEIQNEYAAPITAGQPMGKLILKAPGMKTQTFELVAADAVKRKSAIGRILTALSNRFRG